MEGNHHKPQTQTKIHRTQGKNVGEVLYPMPLT